MQIVLENQNFDQERALYGKSDISLKKCNFDGPADGESALKECSNVGVESCYFNLRYPFWHDNGVTIFDSTMTDKCRAALWYSNGVKVENTKMHGIKALRECKDVVINNSDIISPEFGWSTVGLRMRNTKAESEYFMLRSEDLHFDNVRLKGKYSFQYIKNSTFENCVFDTKDAFWHAENVTVKDSIVNGEYLAWYSDSLTLINCRISGTQPLCYCKNLKLVNCEMYNADLCFEKSDVEATVTTPLISIKNPKSGTITLPSLGETIYDEPDANGIIIIS